MVDCNTVVKKGGSNLEIDRYNLEVRNYREDLLIGLCKRKKL